MNIKAILLDVDGVVVRADPFHVPYYEKHGVGNDKMLPFFQGAFQKCLIGEADLLEEVKPWLTTWNWTGTAEDFLQFWFEAEHNVDNELIESIQKLRESGIYCFLATNSEL